MAWCWTSRADSVPLTPAGGWTCTPAVKYVSNIYKYYVAYTLEVENWHGTQEILEEIRGGP